MDGLTLAYFSMEFGIESAMPTYAGGLGILAGDIVRAAADMGLPAVGITLLYRKGYFRQRLDDRGNQIQCDVEWSPQTYLTLIPQRVLVTVSGHQVQVQAWRYSVTGRTGHIVPVYFLDTCVTGNDILDQGLTDYLYGGDERYRLRQETILGFGGVALLRALGHADVQAYHMNEGHSALITIALFEEQAWGRGLDTVTDADKEAITQHCVFTTHTPLPSGHDEFTLDLAREVLGDERTDFLVSCQCCANQVLNMTDLALSFSRYVNGVSMRHEEISQAMLSNHSNHQIDAVTNGVHAVTWTAPSFCRIFDRYIPQWRRDNLYLKYAVRIPLTEIRRAHTEAKEELLYEIERRNGVCLDPEVLTIGFARRATPYKRMDLLFNDLDRLITISQQVGPVQVIYGGKAHPRDDSGKDLIRKVFEASTSLKGIIPVVYLEEYDMGLAKYLCAGTDLWLNTPQKPQEASGTSGMKAALNGVPTFSVLDGWWIEGHVEGVTGWSIGDGWRSETNLEIEVTSLYDKLEHTIIPMFYQRPDEYAVVMRSAIALNASYYNAQRMVNQYLQNAYMHANQS